MVDQGKIRLIGREELGIVEAVLSVEDAVLYGPSEWVSFKVDEKEGLAHASYAAKK